MHPPPTSFLLVVVSSMIGGPPLYITYSCCGLLCPMCITLHLFELKHRFHLVDQSSRLVRSSCSALWSSTYYFYHKFLSGTLLVYPRRMKTARSKSIKVTTTLLLLLLMSCSTHSTCGVLCTVLFGGVCAATLTF